jgi:hypothetical protein
MRPQGLSTTVASDDGRVWSLVCQRCSIHGNILVEIVEIYATGISLKGLSRSAVRKNDIMTFQLDMQVFNNISVRWGLPPGNAAPVDEIPCRNQKAVYEEAVSVGHVQIAVWHIIIEGTAYDLYWSASIVPSCFAIPLKADAPNPLDGFGFAGDSQNQVADPQIVNRPLPLRGQDLRSLQKAMGPTSTVAVAMAIAVAMTIAVTMAIAVPIALALRQRLRRPQHYGR